MQHFSVTVTYDCRVYNGSAYADYAGRTRYRVLEAEWSGAAIQQVLGEIFAQQPQGSGERVTGITSITCEVSA